LAAVGALRAGAGRLQVATCASVAPGLALAVPEALVMGLPEDEEGAIAGGNDRLFARAARADAVLAGPGMFGGEAIGALVAGLLEHAEAGAIVLDAGALTGLADQRKELRRHAGRVVLTPHAGEMARLLDTGREAVEADPLEAAMRAAAALQCVVVMKGGITHVVTPDGSAAIFEGGTIGLATSGSGDTLAGVITGLLARGTPPAVAAMWGVFLHGEAGCRLMRRHGGIGFLAGELLAEIPSIMAELSGE
jgi:hydroxyethylthiazole kinase-like uncharacterized protein yjeF